MQRWGDAERQGRPTYGRTRQRWGAMAPATAIRETDGNCHKIDLDYSPHHE
jgi:hypothetical protein